MSRRWSQPGPLQKGVLHKWPVSTFSGRTRELPIIPHLLNMVYLQSNPVLLCP